MDRMAMRDDMMGITKEALRFCREVRGGKAKLIIAGG